MKEETCMLAHTYKPNKHSIAGYLSEKLDGMRVIYVPWTRGMKKKDVPFANLARDERLVEEEICTGLWSRYFNCVDAPDWWLDELPNLVMDGELYADIPRQDLFSTVKRKRQNRAPDYKWKEVNLHVFSLPHYTILFKDRYVYNAQIDHKMKPLSWAYDHLHTLTYHSKKPLNFKQEVSLMSKYCTGRAIPHPQTLLPYKIEDAEKIVNERLEEVTARGGEGLMLRKEYSTWVTHRSHDLLKFKKLDDAEATVIGYRSGKITEKDSRNRGKIGALHVKTSEGIIFTIGGLKDVERGAGDHADWCYDHPDEDLPSDFDSESWPRGTVITYQYRGLSKDNVPNEARLLRKHDGYS